MKDKYLTKRRSYGQAARKQESGVGSVRQVTRHGKEQVVKPQSRQEAGAGQGQSKSQGRFGQAHGQEDDAQSDIGFAVSQGRRDACRRRRQAGACEGAPRSQISR
jgi:hypothetical protein